MTYLLAEVVADPALSVMKLLEQGGFLGLSAVLLAFIFWLIRRVMETFTENNKVIAGNTGALTTLNTTQSETKDTLSKIYEELLTRPCIADRVATEMIRDFKDQHNVK